MFKKIGIYLLLFIGVFLLFSSYKQNQDKIKKQDTREMGIELIAYPKSNYKIGNLVSVKINNLSTKDLHLGKTLPPPFTIKHDEKILEYPEVNIEPFWPEILKAGDHYIFSFDRWNNELFGQEGKYTITLNNTELEEAPNIEISIKKRGFFSYLWNTVLYKPIYNVLMFITINLPYKSLGWGIIILTLIIRLILLIPNQRALESQKRLQEVQPKIQEIQEKYKNDKVKISQETMALWKKHKINPMGSCLPLIIQLPILIALYYVVREGLLFSKTIYLYFPLQGIDISTIGTNFMGILPLDVPNRIVIPIILVVLQFFQLKLTTSKKPPMPKGAPDPMKAMMYIMPLMIGFFAATFPAGVSLYWGVSTIFAILQQLVVNKEKKSQMDK